jgi:hypothetical protein
MSCDTCRQYWLRERASSCMWFSMRASLLLHVVQHESDRNRGMHIVKDEMKTLQKAVADAKHVHEIAMDRWQAHRATHNDDAAKSTK